MPARFQPIQAGTDPSQQLAIINKNFGELDNENVKKLFYDNTGLPSIQIGVQQDGTSAIRVSKPGIDVTTATNAQLAFNSTQNTLKIVQTGTATISRPAVADIGAGVWQGSQTQVTVAHGLGYVPVVMAFMLNGAAYQVLPYQALSVPASGSMSQLTYSIAVDSTSIYLTCAIAALHSAVAAGNFSVKYYLLQETAS